MTRTMDPRTNKRNAYKVRQTRMESGRKEDGTTGKGSGSVGKDRKRVPAGGSPYITPPLGTGVLDSSLRRRTVRVLLVELLDRILRVQVVPGNPLVVRVVVSVPLDEVLDPTIPDPGVENPFDLIVVFTIYDDRIGCGGLSTTRKGSGGRGKSLTTGKTG